MSTKTMSKRKLSTEGRYGTVVLDPNFASVSLLLKAASGPTFTDIGPNKFTVTGNNGASVASTSRGDAVALDGTNDYLSLAANSAWAFGTGNFTVEAWVYPASLTSTRVIASTYGTTNSWWLRTSDANLQFGANDTPLIATASGLSLNTWAHVAACRSGTSLRLFVNGSQVGSTATDSTDYNNSSGSLIIGGLNTTLQFYSGNLHDLRITKGVARYTTTFTPPGALT